MVFSPDLNYGPTALELTFKLDSENLLVHSIFHTFQGEAPYTGRSAVFVRLGGCNRGAKTIACLFCDTAFETKYSEVMSVTSVMEIIKEIKLAKTELVVITGGEPLLQQNAVMSLISEIHSKTDLKAQIETNGDYDLSNANKLLYENSEKRPSIICSPKGWNNGNRPFRSLNLDANFVECYRVLISKTDTNYYQVPPEILHSEKILYLSPITVYREDSSKEERQKGWQGKAINVEATGDNLSHAQLVAIGLLDKGYTVRLSSQSHLLYAIP